MARSRHTMLTTPAWVRLPIIALAICLSMAMVSSAFGACYQSIKYGKGIEMPPEAMQREILREMKAGTAPSFRTVSAAEIKKAAGVKGAGSPPWGLTKRWMVGRIKFGTIIMIWDQLEGADRHFTLVHEFAHKIYDWKHPPNPRC